MNYRIYRLNAKEIFIYSIIFTAFDALISYTFYDSIYAFFILLIVFPVFLGKVSRELCLKRCSELRYQFCEMIGFVSTSLSAGASVENSLRDCVTEMEKMFGSEAPIVNELREIRRKLELNFSVAHCFNEFSARTGIEDINDFAAIFTETVRSGGNMKQIIADTVSSIQDKQRIEEEIETMLKGKLLEQKVMMVMPFLIIVYLKISGSEFINLLYHNLMGILVMTACLMAFTAAYIISGKIINIRI